MVGALGALVLAACSRTPGGAGQSGEAPGAVASVTATTGSITADLEPNGMNAWLAYLVCHRGFFMVTDGQVVFPDNDSADRLVHQLASATGHVEHPGLQLPTSWIGPRETSP